MSRSRRVVILVGPPGVGKGTQAKRVAEAFKLYHIDTGSCIRREIASGSELGQDADLFVRSGKLIPFDLVMKVIQSAMEQVPQDKWGFLFDGFPRNIEQANGLKTILENLGLQVDVVLYLTTPQEILVDRLGYRTTCSDKGCQATYNTKLNPPMVANICNLCGSRLMTREDDQPEIVKNRLVTYEKETAPIVGYYTELNVVKSIDANQSIDAVYKALQTELSPLFQTLVQ